MWRNSGCDQAECHYWPPPSDYAWGSTVVSSSLGDVNAVGVPLRTLSLLRNPSPAAMSVDCYASIGLSFREPSSVKWELLSPAPQKSTANAWLTGGNKDSAPFLQNEANSVARCVFQSALEGSGQRSSLLPFLAWLHHQHNPHHILPLSHSTLPMSCCWGKLLVQESISMKHDLRLWWPTIPIHSALRFPKV